MVGELIHIENNATKIDERVYAVPAFKKLLEQKEGKKLLFYVYCICDYFSPYARQPNISDRMKLAGANIFSDRKAPDNKDIREAMRVYNDLQYVPMFDQLDVLKRKAKEIAAALEAIPMTETIGKGKDAVKKDNLNEILTLSEKYERFSSNMRKLEEEIRKHIEANGRETPLVRNISIYEKELREDQIARLGE